MKTDLVRRTRRSELTLVFWLVLLLVKLLRLFAGILAWGVAGLT